MHDIVASEVLQHLVSSPSARPPVPGLSSVHQPTHAMEEIHDPWDWKIGLPPQKDPRWHHPFM